MSNWKDTKIWKKLFDIQGETADKVRTVLNNDICMPAIEILLSKGGTSSKDFTLHDSDHSFRVAERMWHIIPEKTQELLSEYELALLLLSAYLHDIGMTPEYKKVESHHNILLNIDNNLSVSEKEEFQKWLDEEGVFVDLDRGELTDKSRIEEWVTFYCRHKHNDWSKEWISNNLSEKQLSGIYSNWINDLIIICQSHHWGLEELKDSKFDPIRINGKVIHKRYLAMCLRLSDVIEIDPERAPDVLMKHRNVIDGSISHWLKEQFTSVDIINGNITVTARPTQAFIHKAILDVADQIEKETFLCNSLIQEKPLSHISPTHNLEHTWNILPIVYRDIKETGNYEFIDGTFKPNTKKLLELFAGTELYENPLLAIRELIQNAFDAIKVQIAYRIFKDSLKSEEQFNSLKDLFAVNLSAIKEGNDVWLICSDNGVGMDKDIIKKCFLISGSQRRRELLELERKCKSIGYDLELTGKFGIGVMSYFMLADKMIITTKKSFESGNFEQNGWEFEINGLADFGELRRINYSKNGTEIRLRIREELVYKFTDENTLSDFLNDTLMRLPCNFKFTSIWGKEIIYNHGWSKNKDFFKQSILESFDIACTPSNFMKDYISEEELKKRNVSNERLAQIKDRFASSINFIEYEGKLSDNNGYYRLHIPYYKNKRGCSFAFFFEDDNDTKYLKKINNGFYFAVNDNVNYTSWKGMAVSFTTTPNNKKDILPYKLGFVEIDLVNDFSSQISISRLNVEVTQRDKIYKEIEEMLTILIIQNIDSFVKSDYCLFNKSFAPFLKLSNNYLNWTFDFLPDKNEIDFIGVDKIPFPIAIDASRTWDSQDKYIYNGNNIFNFHSLKRAGYGTLDFDYKLFKFDIATYSQSWEYRIRFLINSSLKESPHLGFGNSAQFPDIWSNLFCYIGTESYIVFNEGHALLKYFDMGIYNTILQCNNYFSSVTKEQKEDFYMKSKSHSICYILYLAISSSKDNWIGMIEQNREFANKLWKNAFDDEIFQFVFFNDNAGYSSEYRGLGIISMSGWTVLQKETEIKTVLPTPTEEKWIIIEKRN